MRDTTSYINKSKQPAIKQAVLPIYSVTPFTMLDFPSKTACIVWLTGCNMRCPYCHNPQIVRGKGRGDVTQVIAFLKRRQGLLDGVVLSGGEATSYATLPDFIETIKSLGYAIKLDTNGLRPDMLDDLLREKLLDYVALDYKAPPEKFKRVTGTDKFKDFEKTLNLLCTQTLVPFEVRTTVHTDLINETDVQTIINDLVAREFKGTYALQNFRHDNNRPTLGLLKPQERQLDLSNIKSKYLNIELRNF